MAQSKKPPIKKKSRNPEIKFNKLSMYFGNPYVIDLEGREGTVTLKTPTLEPIIEMGYEAFFASLKPLVTNTTEYKLQLHKAGIDWCTMKDFDLFCILKQNIEPFVCSLLFEGVDLEKFVLAKKTMPDGTSSTVLYNAETKTEIDEEIYFHISQFFRTAFNIRPEEKIVKDAFTKKALLRKEENHLHAMEVRAKQSAKESEDQLFNLISTLVNHPGFKYKLEEIKHMNVCQFFDSVNRIQVYESATALMKGMYSGFVDSSKIDAEAYNFMREIK